MPLRQHVRLGGNDLVLGLQLRQGKPGQAAAGLQFGRLETYGAGCTAAQLTHMQHTARQITLPAALPWLILCHGSWHVQHTTFKMPPSADWPPATCQQNTLPPTSLFILYRRSPIARERLRLPAAHAWGKGCEPRAAGRIHMSWLRTSSAPRALRLRRAAAVAAMARTHGALGAASSKHHSPGRTPAHRSRA